MVMKIKLKGVRAVRTKNKAGRTVEYWYYGRGKGAISLPGQPGSAEFMTAYYEASKTKVQSKAGQITLSSVLTRFKGAVEFTGLKPRTREDYVKHIDKIGAKFGSMPLTLFRQTHAKKINGLFLNWKDKLAAKSVRQADYTLVVLNRVLNIASQRGWIEVNPIETVKRTYKARRQHILSLLWHSYHGSQSEAGAAEWTSQAHGVCQMIKQHAPDGRQCRVRWRSAGLSFPPLWLLASADAAGTGKRSMSSAYADAGPATSGPRSDRARVLP